MSALLSDLSKSNNKSRAHELGNCVTETVAQETLPNLPKSDNKSRAHELGNCVTETVAHGTLVNNGKNGRVLHELRQTRGGQVNFNIEFDGTEITERRRHMLVTLLKKEENDDESNEENNAQKVERKRQMQDYFEFPKKLAVLLGPVTFEKQFEVKPSSYRSKHWVSGLGYAEGSDYGTDNMYRYLAATRKDPKLMFYGCILHRIDNVYSQLSKSNSIMGDLLVKTSATRWFKIQNALLDAASKCPNNGRCKCPNNGRNKCPNSGRNCAIINGGHRINC